MKLRRLLPAAAVLAALACAREPEKPESEPLAKGPPAATAPATYEGYYDIANCNGITAWAWDTSRPDVAIDIDVYDGSRKIVTLTAGQFREDLKAAGKGNGKHGLLLVTPQDLKDGRPHHILIRFAGTSQELTGQARDLNCATQ